MLDDDEYEGVMAIWEACFHQGRDHPTTPSAERYQLVSKEYERITGVPGCHPNAIGHHRISDYGPPCKTCGKPLLAPKAKLCGACGAKFEPNDACT